MLARGRLRFNICYYVSRLIREPFREALGKSEGCPSLKGLDVAISITTNSIARWLARHCDHTRTYRSHLQKGVAARLTEHPRLSLREQKDRSLGHTDLWSSDKRNKE